MSQSIGVRGGRKGCQEPGKPGAALGNHLEGPIRSLKSNLELPCGHLGHLGTSREALGKVRGSYRPKAWEPPESYLGSMWEPSEVHTEATRRHLGLGGAWELPQASVGATWGHLWKLLGSTLEATWRLPGSYSPKAWKPLGNTQERPGPEAPWEPLNWKSLERPGSSPGAPLSSYRKAQGCPAAAGEAPGDLSRQLGDTWEPCGSPTERLTLKRVLSVPEILFDSVIAWCRGSLGF